MNQRWLPGTFTQPLSEDFVTDGPRLRRFCELLCTDDKGRPLVLDEWQAWLIDHALERYPDDWPVEKLRGRLRYRQIVVSMGRQNGKSVLGMVMGFYGLLMHEDGPEVISVASNADQARIVFKRLKKVIDEHPALRKKFKTTHTRGITRLDKPGAYSAKPAKADALQGIAATMVLFDEVHICPEDMWSALVFGTSAQLDGMVFGITTAGGDNSTLLKTLYEEGRQAAAGSGNERLGFFLWEAQVGAAVDDPEALMDANPALASGRLDIDQALSDIRGMPEHEARRFRLNQFVSSESTWLPMQFWTRAAAGPIPAGKVVFAIDRSPSWEHASITATVKVGGIVYTELVASFVKPNKEWLLNVCLKLAKHNPGWFVMEAYGLGSLADDLIARGLPVKVIRGMETANACSVSYSLLADERARHANDPVLNAQMPHAVRRNTGDAWRINRQASSSSIDAVMAMVFGMYVAETLEPVGMQVF